MTRRCLGASPLFMITQLALIRLSRTGDPNLKSGVHTGPSWSMCILEPCCPLTPDPPALGSTRSIELIPASLLATNLGRAPGQLVSRIEPISNYAAARGFFFFFAYCGPPSSSESLGRVSV